MSPVRRRRRASVLVILAVAVAAVLAGGGIAAYQTGAFDPPRRPTVPETTEPASVAPPASLDLPSASAAPAVAEPAPTTGTLNAAAVRAALAGPLGTPGLGRRVTAMVAPLAGGPAAVADDRPMVPASTMKLLTTTAALSSLGGATTFETTVVQAGSGPTRRIVLVGGGDPYLASRPTTDPSVYPPRADVTTLARRTAAALRADGVRAVRLGYDASRFSGPSANPTWPADYLTDGVVSPISALWVDRGNDPSGFGNVADPARAAATTYAAALRAAGLRVRGEPQATVAPAGMRRVAAVTSPTVEQIVQEILLVSDNEAAEVLAHQVGLAVAKDGSFAGGVTGVETTLRRLGVPLTGARITDGSGLSRTDRLQPSTLVALLRLAASADHPELRPVIEGLPVAGFSGSLTDRDGDARGAARGLVRAKTGTLTGVSGLAGLAEGADGSQLVFVLLADRIVVPKTLDARAALDRAAAALASCRCGSAAPAP